MQVNAYIGVIFFMGICFFLVVIAALYWAAKKGHMSNLEKASRSVFSDEEPEGKHTDYFPGERDTAARVLEHNYKHSPPQ